MVLLDVRDLTVRFGGLIAVNEVSLQLKGPSILGIIGPNGAGKTTLFSLISGFLKPLKGEVFWKNQKITGLKPYQIASRGIVRTFQSNVVYGDVTVYENIVCSQHLDFKTNLLQGVLNTRSYREDEKAIRKRVQKTIDFMELNDWTSNLAGGLPHGIKRKLGMAMAMACDPRIIMLDEPTAGMDPTESLRLMQKIRKLPELGIAVMLVEHDMKVIMGVCDNIVVLNYGQKIAEGSPNEIQKNRKVIEAYLGSEEILL